MQYYPHFSNKEKKDRKRLNNLPKAKEDSESEKYSLLCMLTVRVGGGKKQRQDIANSKASFVWKSVTTCHQNCDFFSP